MNLEVTRSGRTWLVEVKATREQRGVRMTAKQAKEAVKGKSRFLLCVVVVTVEEPRLEDVREGMRFVENIGEAIAPLCSDLDKLEGFREEITASESSGVQLEVTSGDARIRVASSVWEEEGFRLEDLADRLTAR